MSNNNDTITAAADVSKEQYELAEQIKTQERVSFEVALEKASEEIERRNN